VTGLASPGELLRAFQHGAKKQFGQHFLVDPSILDRIAGFADLAEGDAVLEIGPGCGTLTATLLRGAARVRAAEIDRDAIAFLKRELVPVSALEIVEGDVLRQDFSTLLDDDGRPWKVVANLPYNVATEIYFRLAMESERWSVMVLMFQKEVAQRMTARVGDKAYGVLSLMCELYTDARIVMTLPPGAFVPPPRVHSAVVRFTPISGTRIPDEEIRRTFERLVKGAFQGRRKTFTNAIKGLGYDREQVLGLLRELGYDERIRPEGIDFAGYEALARRLSALNP
jgi:16S rRNA (adenine1518-N6/adenine1519-N6)-dimethyltransferase